jgi:hypothetical protein
MNNLRKLVIALGAAALVIVATGEAQSAEVVKSEHRMCKRDADCQLVEVPCTCGQTKLAVNVQHLQNYNRYANCTKTEVSHCAKVGASVARSAVCKAGQCDVAMQSFPSSH